MMESKAEYKSSIRSKKMIREAYLELIQEKEIPKITVTDIVRRADINRSTFYAHYTDIRGVQEELENEIIAKMMDVLSEFRYSTFFKKPAPVLLKISRDLEEDIEFYRILILSEASDSFLDKLQHAFVDYMLRDSDIPARVRSSPEWTRRIWFFAGGMTAMYKQWFAGNVPGTLNDISMEVADIISKSSERFISTQ
jgi:AcrR family transcriptional regulator